MALYALSLFINIIGFDFKYLRYIIFLLALIGKKNLSKKNFKNPYTKFQYHQKSLYKIPNPYRKFQKFPTKKKDLKTQ